MKQKKDYSDKPYNRCLSCPHRGTRCDGPRTAGMTLERWCEYMRDMKEVNGLIFLFYMYNLHKKICFYANLLKFIC